MIISYSIFDPTGNITLLVETPVPREKQPGIAGYLMSREPEAEQVGFIEAPSSAGALARLQMAGGEFCGNAAISLAGLLAGAYDLSYGRPVIIPLEVSGALGIVECRIEPLEDGYIGTIDMPLPRLIEMRTFYLDGLGYDLTVVHMPGISHIIFPSALIPALSEPAAERALIDWSSIIKAEACGLLLLDEEASHLTPLVYVPSVGSLVWEHGCASGSAAVAAYLAYKAASDADVKLRQPGGTIRARARARDEIYSLSICARTAFKTKKLIDTGPV